MGTVADIRSSMPKIFVIFLLPLLLSSCNLSGVAVKMNNNNRPPEGKPSGPVGSLSNATSVEIENDWNGYSDITPIVRHYRFKLENTALAGDGHFAIGGYGGYNIHQQYSKKIMVPADLTQQFLDKLATAPLVVSRKYKPKMVRRDDFPRVMIRVKAPDREVVFTSRSQGEKNAPWQVRVKKNKVTEYYVSDSPIPGLAMDLLRPQIDHPGLEEAINKARGGSPVKTATIPTGTIPTVPKPNTPK
jgi:hypothetical protein